MKGIITSPTMLCSGGVWGRGQKERSSNKTFGLSTPCDNQASIAKGCFHSTIQSSVLLFVFVILHMYYFHHHSIVELRI